MDHLREAKYWLEAAGRSPGNAPPEEVARVAPGHALVPLVEQLQSPTTIKDDPFTTLRVLSKEERVAIEEAVAQASRSGQR